MSELPYVISAELEYADSTALRPKKIESFRQKLDKELRDAGKNTVWLGAEALRLGMGRLFEKTNLPIVSLDQRYVTDADAYLGVSRAVNAELSDAGYDARLGFRPLNEQLDELGRRYSGQEIVLADDVLFSGEMIAALQRELADRDVEVPALLCGIAIGEGAEKLATLGIKTESVNAFNEVDDELCERDFTLLSGSGRKILGQQASALYFDSRSGKPEWASIPSDIADDFCVSSLLSNRELLPTDMPTPNFVGYPAGSVGDVIDSVLAIRSGA